MFQRIVFFGFFTILLFSFKVDAGWPEDGWIGIEGHSLPAQLSQAHRQLAQDEERVTKALPSSNINAVLTKLVFLGHTSDEFKEVNFLGPQEKIYIFESGWNTTLNQNPVPQIVQRLVRPYAAQLQKAEGLDTTQQQELASAVCGVSEIMQVYQTEIFPRFESYEGSITVSEILQRAHNGLLRASTSSSPGYSLFQSLQRDGQIYETKSQELERERTTALVSIDEINQDLQRTQSVPDTEILLKNLDQETRKKREAIAKCKKEVETVGSKVIATYWHSEQKFLKFLEDSMEKILSQPAFQNLGFIPKKIIFQLHSRFDICSFCSHVLARALTQPDGILERFRQAIVNKLRLDHQTPLYFITSFREVRENSKNHFRVEKDHLNGFEDLNEMKQQSAFPLMHIPNPSEL